jgi:hypothetical protein
MAPRRSTEDRVATAETRARVMELRRQSRTFVEIGAEFGFSMQRAHQIYLDALTAIPARQVDLYRAEALELALGAIEDLLPIATNHTQPRTSVEAWNSIRSWSERIAKTVGSDASTKVDATVMESYDPPELAALVLRAKERAAATRQKLLDET